jgi:hypothetical protein
VLCYKPLCQEGYRFHIVEALVGCMFLPFQAVDEEKSLENVKNWERAEMIIREQIL